MNLHNHILILLPLCHSTMTVVILLVYRDFSLLEEGTVGVVRSSSALTRRGEHGQTTGTDSRPTQEPKQTYTSNWSRLAFDTLYPFLCKCLSISCRTSRAAGHAPYCPLSVASSPGWMHVSRPTSCRFQMVSVGQLLILIQKPYSCNPKVLFL